MGALSGGHPTDDDADPDPDRPAEIKTSVSGRPAPISARAECTISPPRRYRCTFEHTPRRRGRITPAGLLNAPDGGRY